MRIRTDSDGWITAVGSGLTDYDHEIETEKDIEPADPSRVEEAWNWNDGSPEKQSTGNNIPPNPTTAYDKINNYFIDKEGSTDAGLDRVDSLMSNYPTADRAIDNEAYEIAKNRIDKADNDGELTSTEASDLKDILDGKS